MKKFSELKESLSPLSKISAEQFAEARLSFSELPQEEQDTAKVDLDALEAKVEDEAPASKDTPPEDTKIEETPTPPDTPEVQDETPPPADTAKTFSEAGVAKLFSEFGVKSLEDLSKKFHELQAEKVQVSREKEVSSMTFSESNKSAPFLDKAKDKLMAFHEKFGALAFAEMVKIVDKANLAPSALIFSEVGK